MTIHWYAPSPPESTRINLRIEAPLGIRDWGLGIRVPMDVRVGTSNPQSLISNPPRVVSIPVVTPALRVSSFRFPEPAAAQSLPPGGKGDRHVSEGNATTGHPLPSPLSPLPSSAHTRIQPPRDVIKLSDRLEYLLQPSLGIALGRQLAGVLLAAVSIPIGRRRVLVPAASGDLGRRDGAGQDDAGNHGHPLAVAPGSAAKRAAGLPQAVGHELAAGIHRLGAGGADDGHRGPTGQTPLAVAVARRPRAHRQLRVAAARPLRRKRTVPFSLTRKSGQSPASIWSCSTNRSASRTAPARPARWLARFPASGAGR